DVQYLAPAVRVVVQTGAGKERLPVEGARGVELHRARVRRAAAQRAASGRRPTRVAGAVGQAAVVLEGDRAGRAARGHRRVVGHVATDIDRDRVAVVRRVNVVAVG